MIAGLLVIPGVFLLMKGADFFVESAASIAKKLNISPMVIGLIVVAFGTSLPELVANIISAVNNNTEIAFGNIVGSNIANILLILGLSAIILPLVVKHNTVWKEIPMSFLAAILLFIFALQRQIDTGKTYEIFSKSGSEIAGSITFTHGIFLLFIFIIFLYYTFGIAKNNDTTPSEINEMSITKSTTYFILGLFAVVMGGKFMVDGVLAVARSFGISESLLGLTVVAVGTSLPELVTNIVAAKRGCTDIAVGNVIGSNIFNIFFILGLTALIRPVPVTYFAIVDISFLLFVTFLTFLFLFVLDKYKVGKIEGVIMLLLYCTYLLHLVFRG